MSNFWDRSLSLKVQIGSRIKEFDGLKVDFDVLRSIGGTYDSADITIHGLDIRDASYLTTEFDNSTKMVKKNIITLTGGYGPRIGSIFRGGITQARPSIDSPDISVAAHAKGAYYKNVTEEITYSNKMTMFSALCQTLAKALELKLMFNATDKKLGAFSYQGAPFGLLEKMRSFYEKIKIYIDGETLYVDDWTMPPLSKAIEISDTSGLIGSPEPSFIGCTIKALLMPNIKPSDMIILNTKKLPNLNGSYRATYIKHQGSSRQDMPFYTIIEANNIMKL